MRRGRLQSLRHSAESQDVAGNQCAPFRRGAGGAPVIARCGYCGATACGGVAHASSDAAVSPQAGGGEQGQSGLAGSINRIVGQAGYETKVPQPAFLRDCTKTRTLEEADPTTAITQ